MRRLAAFLRVGVAAPILLASSCTSILGYDDIRLRPEPTGPPRVTAVSAGGVHTCALLDTGRVSCWGTNVKGALGDGTTELREHPTPVALSGAAVEIALGLSHSCARLADGTVQCWGGNGAGQLGDGSTTDRTKPVAIALRDVVQISLGSTHSCARLTDKSMWCWGENAGGQLGDGTKTPRTTPTRVASLPNVAAIAVGGRHSCALLEDGSAKCFGSNDHGQLGDATTEGRPLPTTVGLPSKAVAIFAGDAHSAALLSDGSAWCWGANKSGQLGDKSLVDRPTPVSLAEPGIIAMALGELHSCARLAGSVRCWGENSAGQLGIGTTEDSSEPKTVLGLAGVAAITASGTHTCALSPDGVLSCWGGDFFRELGIDAPSSCGFAACNQVPGVVRFCGRTLAESSALGHRFLVVPSSDRQRITLLAIGFAVFCAGMAPRVLETRPEPAERKPAELADIAPAPTVVARHDAKGCPPGTLFDDGACIKLPDDESFGEDPVGAPEGEAAWAGHHEKSGRWFAYEQIPRRPDRPADYDKYVYPIPPGLPGGKYVVSGYDLDLPDIMQRRGKMRAVGHGGVDLPQKRGTPIKLIALDHQVGDAEVIHVGKLFGLSVVTRHTLREGGRERDYVLIFGHIDAAAAGLTKGQYVKAGEVIAYVGDTGSPELVHLHLEARRVRDGIEASKLAPGGMVAAEATIVCDPRNVLPLK